MRQHFREPHHGNTTMYQRAINHQQYADFLDGAIITAGIREAAAWVNTGTHAVSGAFVSIQGTDGEWVLVHSERPLPLPFLVQAMPADGLCELAA